MNQSGQPPVLFGLLHAASAIEGRLEQTLETVGLSLAKLAALHQLTQGGGSLTLGQLAERLSCVKSNVTQLVDRLAADGLVARVDDPSDRRTILATITKKGRAQFEKGARLRDETERELLAAFSVEDLERLGGLLRRFDAGPNG